MIYVQLLVGFVLLLGGAEFLVRGAAAIATRLAISSLAVGMSLVAFGTSAPELVVGIDAALSGAPDIAVGNIVGSNIANIMLILGVSAAICPIAIGRPLRHDALVLGGATILFSALAWSGTLGRWAGMALVAALIAFIASTGRREHRQRRSTLASQAGEEPTTSARGWIAWACIAGGLAGIILGADQLVQGSIALARTAGVSEAVIGLTLVAVGTSLPELATSAVAAARGHSEIAVGNVVGSNLFNMLCVGGLVATAVPLPVAEEIRSFDLWIMLAATAAVLPFLFTNLRMGRLFGVVLFCCYAGYIAILLGAASSQPLIGAD